MLYIKFFNNVLVDEENYVIYIIEDQFDGLFVLFVKVVKVVVEFCGEEGKYVIINMCLFMDLFLIYLIN